MSLAARLMVAAAEAQVTAQRERMAYDAASGLFFDAAAGCVGGRAVSLGAN